MPKQVENEKSPSTYRRSTDYGKSYITAGSPRKDHQKMQQFAMTSRRKDTTQMDSEYQTDELFSSKQSVMATNPWLMNTSLEQSSLG